MKRTSLLALFCVLAACASTPKTQSTTTQTPEIKTMELGNFSVSLAVKDLQTSKDFYEKLGFTQFGGQMEMNYLIMQNGTATIGLFQGMFEENIMTFNPGWNRSAETLDQFEDVRAIQTTLKERGIQPVTAVDETSDGPASMVITDPDGNTILIDQHVAKPKN